MQLFLLRGKGKASEYGASRIDCVDYACLLRLRAGNVCGPTVRGLQEEVREGVHHASRGGQGPLSEALLFEAILQSFLPPKTKYTFPV